MLRWFRRTLKIVLALVLVVLVGTGVLFFNTDNAKAAILTSPSVTYLGGGSFAFVDSYEVDSQGKVYVIFTGFQDTYFSSNSNGTFYDKHLSTFGGGVFILDSQAKVHLLYDPMMQDGYNLVYSNNTSGQWIDHVIVTGDADVSASPIKILVDSRDNAHLIFFHTIRHDSVDGNRYVINLTQAIGSGGKWINQTIVEDVDAYNVQAIIDSQDYIHITYIDGTNGNLMYVTDAAGSWNVQTIDDGNVSTSSINFIADFNGHLHLCYNYTNGTMRYASNDMGSWSALTIAVNVDEKCKMIIDSQDHVHLLFHQAQENLIYTKNYEGNWNLKTISEGSPINYYSMAIDTQTQAHIIYGTENTLGYSTNDEGVWNTTWFNGGLIEKASIALDSANMAHIIYADGNGLFYATDIEGSWNIQELPGIIASDRPDASISDIEPIIIDSNDQIHMFYSIYGPGEELYYASFKPLNVSQPGLPSSFVAIPGNTHVQLSWSVPSYQGGVAITGYNLSWSTNPNGPYTSILINATNYLHEGLENGRTYYYTLSAINSLGEGDKTDAISTTPNESTFLPSPPTNILLTTVNGNISLQWTAPSENSKNITGYMIYRGTSPSSITYIDVTTEMTFLDTNVTSNQTYYYQVSAVSEAGEGERSGMANITVPPSSNKNSPTSLIDTLEGQLALAGLGIVAVGAVTFTLWRWRRL